MGVDRSSLQNSLLLESSSGSSSTGFPSLVPKNTSFYSGLKKNTQINQRNLTATSIEKVSSHALSLRSLSQTVLISGQRNSSSPISLMAYASPSLHDFKELKETLKDFEEFYQGALSSVQMDLRKRVPLKIEVKISDKSLVDPQEKSFFSRAVSYESPEEVIQIFKKKAPEHEDFIRRVRAFSRSILAFQDQDSAELLRNHSQFLRKVHARLIQARDAYLDTPRIHQEYSQLAERILHLQLCSRPDLEDRTLGSSLSSSRLFSSLKSVERIPFANGHHADWVNSLFDSIGGPFTDDNRGGLLHLSTIKEHFEELDRSGKVAVAARLVSFLKESFNVDIQDFKRSQVFSVEALAFFSEILTTILPTMGLECDDWVSIPSSEFSKEVQQLMEELEITLLERDGKCIVFSKSLDDFGVTDSYVRSCVNTALGALTSEMDSKRLEKFLRLSKPFIAFFSNKNISHVCFSGVLRAGAYLQLLRYQTEMDARACYSTIFFCGVFRGAFDYIPLYSRFSQLDALKHECQATDLSTHHIEDSWAMKTPRLTTVPGALLHHQAEFTSLGVTDRTLNSRDPSRYIFGQDRYIGYFVEVMGVCQQLVDKIRPLRFGASEAKAMAEAETEALLEAEKTGGILEVASFQDKISSLEEMIKVNMEFAPTACRSLENISLEVAKKHIELLHFYRCLELYLETADLFYLQNFTKFNDCYYGIQDSEGNNLIFCTGVYNTPLLAGPSTRGIEGFPVSTTMEANYCSKELCKKIHTFCGPNPTIYVGGGAAADSVSVMGRLHKNVFPEGAISVVCFAPRLGEWGAQYRDAKVDTDERLKEQHQHKIDIISIVSTKDPCFTDRKLKKRLERRGAVLAFNPVLEPALSCAAELSRKAATTAAKVEREDFSPYFGPFIRCLERYMKLRCALDPVLSQRRGSASPLELSHTEKLIAKSAEDALTVERESSLLPTARKIFELVDEKSMLFPTKEFKKFLVAYGEAAQIAPLNTKEDIQECLDSIEVSREALIIKEEELEECGEEVKGIGRELKGLDLIEEAIRDNLDIPDEALYSFENTTRKLPAYTRFTLIKDPKVREGYAALQERYLLGKTPEYALAFMADVGESRFAANSQNGARLVKDLATGKYAVVFKPVKTHLSWTDFAKRKAGQISHTLVSDGGMREMEQWNEIWAQTLGYVLGVGCTLTEGGMARLTNGESGVALPFLKGYKSAAQCQGLLDRLYHKEQIGKVHDFFAINIISGDQDGHLENWMVLEKNGILKDVCWIDAGNAFTWSDPSSWWWGGFSANYRAWKTLPVSNKSFEGVFSRESLKKKLPSYDYKGIQHFAGRAVNDFKRYVNQGRFLELLKDHQHKKEHFELVLTRMQRRLEALLLYICTVPNATPAGAAEYTYDRPQAWTRFTDWSVTSFIQNNKDAAFVV